MHFVYILRSAHDDGLYIGYSANLRRRFMQHCEGTACATAHRRRWTLIYYEAYIDPADALGRERYLKSGAGRRFQKRNYRITCKTTHSKQPRERSLYAAMIYTHVLNRPGLGIRSPLDFDAPSTGR